MMRACLVILIVYCTTPVNADVPVTGREQHMLYARAPVQAAAAQAYHAEVSRLAANGMLDNDRQTLIHIRHISSQLIAQAIHLKPAAANWAWEVHITSDPQVAAFSMAGGKLLVGTHFIKSYKLSDDELAVALAHEIGHVIAEHVREQISMAASYHNAVSRRTQTVAEVIDSMDSDISIFLRLQPLSRLQEMEADDIGIELAARSGIPPTAVISFYNKLAQTPSGQSIFDTHGSSAQRVKFADSMAGYAWPLYEASHKANASPRYASVNVVH